jgi:dTDP-4-dehydrorhamnose reductase
MGVVLSPQIRVKPRYLVVGVDGLLGGTLRRYWLQQGQAVASTSLLPVENGEGVLHLDLAQSPEKWPELPPCRAAVLCAAITNLEQCRRDPVGTSRVNVTHTLELAQRLLEKNCFVVVISSNLVFNGAKPCCPPEEPFSPRTEYGRQKAQLEASLTTLGDRVGIVRLTKVMHAGLPLIRGWKQALGEGKQITPFTDFLCSPITLDATVRIIATVAENELGGVWQLSASSDISYAEVAQHLVCHWKYDPALIQPLLARDTANLEHLPSYTTLDASKSEKTLGFEILDPVSVLDQALLFHETKSV